MNQRDFFRIRNPSFFISSFEPPKINPGLLYFKKSVDLFRTFTGRPQETAVQRPAEEDGSMAVFESNLLSHIC